MNDFRSLFRALQLDQAIGPDQPGYVNYYGMGEKYGIADDPIRQLATGISFGQTEGSALHLVSGQRGTGKSSELLRLKAMLEEDGYEVWLTNLEGIFEHSEPIEIGEFLIGAASELIGHLKLENASFFERLGNFLRTEIDVEREFKIGVGPDGFQAEFGVAFRSNPSFREKLREKLRARIDAVWRQTADYVEQLAASRCKRVVWIMDSIDRLSGRYDNAKAVADSVVMLFSLHADKLRFAGVQTVAVVHPWLGSAVGAAMQEDSATFLPTIRVRTREGHADPDRIRILLDIAQARQANVFELIPSPLLSQLALMSGGDLREYFKLVRNTAVLAGSRQLQPPLTQSVIDKVLSDARNDLLPLADDEIQWLRTIAKTKQCNLPTRDQVLELARLLNGKYVMNYRNGFDWYDVHPLLSQIIDEPAAGQ